MLHHTHPPTLTDDDLRRLKNLHIMGELPETAPVVASMQRLHLHGFISLHPSGKAQSRLTDAGHDAIERIIKEKSLECV